jgi:beta-lactamase class A
MRSLILTIAVCVFAHAGVPAADLLAGKTLSRIKAVGDRYSGAIGFSVIDLANGRTFGLNEENVFAQASSIKVPLMIEVFRSAAAGKLDLQEKITLESKDVVGGSGHLQTRLRSGPATFTVNELVTAMIETSDNTATNKLIAMVGMDPVNRLLDSMDLRTTRLRRIMLDTAAARRGEENVSTPREMARLMELIYRGKAGDPASSSRMIDILKLVKADFRDVIPAHVPVASKPGIIPGVRCETGIVYLERRPFVMSVMSAFLGPEENPVKEIAGILFEHFEKLANSNPYGNKTY